MQGSPTQVPPTFGDYSISEYAGLSSQAAGVFAGFSLTAVLLILAAAQEHSIFGHRDAQSLGSRGSELRQRALTSTVVILSGGFFAMIITCVMYAILAAEASDEAASRPFVLQLINDCLFNTSGILVAYGVSSAFLAYGVSVDHARRSLFSVGLFFNRVITTVFGPLLTITLYATTRPMSYFEYGDNRFAYVDWICVATIVVQITVIHILWLKSKQKRHPAMRRVRLLAPWRPDKFPLEGASYKKADRSVVYVAFTIAFMNIAAWVSMALFTSTSFVVDPLVSAVPVVLTAGFGCLIALHASLMRSNSYEIKKELALETIAVYSTIDLRNEISRVRAGATDRPEQL